MFRTLGDISRSVSFASEQLESDLPFPVKKHKSLLRRKLGTLEPRFQENKITNLNIARPHIDGILIKPGQTFSFWKRVGQATAEKGYLEGLQISHGEMRTGVGGGLCQLANMLLWMAFHSPLEITERHHHSFDPFPDDRRVLPFGSGASVFFNYIDLRFYNPTDATIQIRLWLSDEHLNGALRADKELPNSYSVFEKNHRFLRQDGKNYRENEIWREVRDRRTGNRIGEELLVKNFSEVKYDLPADVCCVTD